MNEPQTTLEQAPRTRPSARARPSAGARRTGYAIGALVNVVLLALIHGWPGWAAVPFLTDDLQSVLWLVDLTLVAGVLVNLVYVWRDPPWLRAAGGLLIAALGVAPMVALLQVFPFDFGADVVLPWDLLVRIALWLGVVGSVIAVVVNLVTVVREVGRASDG